MGGGVGVAVAHIYGSLDEFAPLPLFGGIREPSAEGLEDLLEGRDSHGVHAKPPVLGTVGKSLAYVLLGEDACEEPDGQVGQFKRVRARRFRHAGRVPSHVTGVGGGYGANDRVRLRMHMKVPGKTQRCRRTRW